MKFQKATKRQSRARIALIGPSGSGKTYTALSVASALGSRVAVIDSERGSAAKYSDRFAFDVLELDSFSPARYVEAIQVAEREGYEVIVVDSLSHAWMGKDGALEQVDRRAGSGNSFTAWREVTPMHNALVEALVRCGAHLIATMRAKTEYVLEEHVKNGRKIQVPRKVGLAPVQRDGLEYEFDVTCDLDLDHNLRVSKTRCPALDGEVFERAGPPLAKTILAWLSDGVAVDPAPAPPAHSAGAVIAELHTPVAPPAAAEAPPAPPAIEHALTHPTPDWHAQIAAAADSDQIDATWRAITAAGAASDKSLTRAWLARQAQIAAPTPPPALPPPTDPVEALVETFVERMAAVTTQQQLDAVAADVARQIAKDHPVRGTLIATYRAVKKRLAGEAAEAEARGAR